MTVPITVARGDGIGPEIMDAVLRILDAGGADIAPEYVDLGFKVYEQGVDTGVSDAAWQSIGRTRLLLKAPLTTPQGRGYKSVNVTLRKALDLFANVRPVRTYAPFVASKHRHIDLVVVRENEEDLYAGMEYRLSDTTCQSLKLVSRPGSTLINRFAFEYAQANGRRKVSVMIKDNIMKLTDGLFHRTFQEVAEGYPDIAADSHIVDIGMARVADTPEAFDVIVTLNLYGDILSDIASQIAGSVGLCGSFNIGSDYAMFEAVHGSAPDIAGKDIANPSGLLHAAILMLRHVGQCEAAARIENAWLCALEHGQHTGDIAGPDSTRLGTAGFADAVIARLGQVPATLPAAPEGACSSFRVPRAEDLHRDREATVWVGVDVFLDEDTADGIALGQRLDRLEHPRLEFKLLANRGVRVYPPTGFAVGGGDLWCARYRARQPGRPVSRADVRSLLALLEDHGLDWVKTEPLIDFAGERGYALQQGE